jgi:hypothetical protein
MTNWNDHAFEQGSDKTMKNKETHVPDTSINIQRGQAIVLIAMGFIMLLAFTGLVVDVARVFVTRGELRRAVDAAGLAATSQFRQGATPDKIVNAAYDLVATHGIVSPTVKVETCDLGLPTIANAELCPPPGQPKRKLVRVTASAEVPMLFLQIVGVPNVQVSGENMSEAASVEAVLILDNSESQSYNFTALPEPYASHCNQTKINDIYACLNGGTLEDGTTVNGCNKETITDPNPNYPALTRGICQPFRKTKEAAYAFIKRLYPGYDRVAIINFNENASQLVPLTGNLDGAPGSAIDLINNMDVFVSPNKASQPNPNGHVLCNSDTPPADFWKCGSSNISEGLIYANNVFANASNPPRQDALWVTLLLVDGAANRAPLNTGLAWSDPQYGVCPLLERTTPLKCRDADSNTRHHPADVGPGFGLYDADDYARDAGDQLGLNPDKFGSPLPGGKPAGVLIYTIALGKNSVCSNGNYTPPGGGGAATCTNPNPVYGDPDAAEQLLRYIADVGDDGDPTTGPCLDRSPPFRDPATEWDASGRSDDAGLGLQCGNYYFAPDADELERIFLEIAGRIFTRISG